MNFNKELVKVIFNEEIDLIKWLLAQELQINAKDKAGDTLLHVAAASVHATVVTLLIDNGASINALSGNGDTPLHRGAYHGHYAVVLLLSR